MLQRVRFVPLQGTLADFRLYVLLAPHLANRGSGNTAWVGDYKGTPMLFAERDSFALALGVLGAVARPIGRVRRHVSDGWQELQANKRLLRTYQRAENGNVALTGEVDLRASDGAFVLALGFGPTAMEAGQHALISLLEDFDRTKAAYVAGGRPGTRRSEAAPPRRRRADRCITSARRCCARTNRNAWKAASSPACRSRGASPRATTTWAAITSCGRGIWSRPPAGFLAVGARHEARRVLRYLQVTQEPDGHWSQNMWLDGTPYWHGIQMDETALPILLVDLAAREGVLDAERARCVLADGAARRRVSRPQWSRQPAGSLGGGSGLLAVHDRRRNRRAAGRRRPGRRGRRTRRPRRICGKRPTPGTPASNDGCMSTGTALAQQHGVDGYYVRVAEPDRADAASPCHGFVPIKNRPPDQSTGPAALMVSLDALAFVRFGLRAPDDPRIVNTVKVIDATLKVDTPHGPAWHRYQGDGYGEHADGAPFDGTGIGRAWPLLTGERAHYELAAGRPRAAEQLAQALEAFAGDSGLLPEQIWDSADIPERELFLGHASGSAMPLVWAHAEYLKLCRSLRDGEVFDRPPQTVQRYLGNKAATSRACDLALQQQGAHDARPQNAPRRDAGPGHGALERGRLADRTRYRRRATRRSASMWWTFRRRACDVATVWISRSIGRRRTDGRAPISSSASSDGPCPHVRGTPA